MENLFGSRAWYNLVPDQTHAFVTGGYGSFMNGVSGNGSGTGNNFLFTGNNYVTAALTPDGSLGMAYLPQGGTITVAMTKFQNTITARWFDPSANTFTAIAGSPFSNTGTQNFTPPGNNSAGNPDWVLVLETFTNPLQIATGSLPSATMGVTYSYQIQASGGSPAYSWSLASSSPPLPPDLSFSANGVLSGLPTITGVFTLMVQVLDSTNAWATKNFAILITTPDTTATDDAIGTDGDNGQQQPDQFELDGFDRHCGSDRLSAATQPGNRFDEFHPAGCPDRDQLQRYWVDVGDDLQLPGTGDRRGRQFEWVFERGKRNDAVGTQRVGGGVWIQ